MIRMSPSWLRWLAAGVARWLAVYCLFLLALMTAEERLLYPRGGEYRDHPGIPHEEIWIATSDGVRLNAWFCPAPTAYEPALGPQRPVVLFLHGNGEQVSSWVLWILRWQKALGADILLLDYRGYGKSEGLPYEAGLYRDGRAAYDWLTKTRGIDPSRIVLVGNSLGGAVAVELATTVEHRALVLQSTFTSARDAAAHVYPWLPVHSIMRNHFPSLERIGRCNRPVFISHGDKDTIIPIEQGRRLYEAAHEPKQFLEIKDLGHDPLLNADYYQAVREFLMANSGKQVDDSNP